MCCSLTLGNTGFMVSTHLQPDNDIVALLPVPAQDLIVGGDEVAQVQVCPDVQAFHGALQVLWCTYLLHQLRGCISGASQEARLTHQ